MVVPALPLLVAVFIDTPARVQLVVSLYLAGIAAGQLRGSRLMGADGGMFAAKKAYGALAQLGTPVSLSMIVEAVDCPGDGTVGSPP
jgi:hypothetical protein